MTVAKWNALTSGDMVSTQSLNSNLNPKLKFYDVLRVRPRPGSANVVTLYSRQKETSFDTSDFLMYEIQKKAAKPKAPQPIHYEPRAVVSWCPEEFAEKFGIAPAEGAQFLDEIEDGLEEAMTKAGWNFILAKADQRGWEEVDG